MIIGLDAADAATPRVVEVDADKNGVLLAIGDGGALVERNKSVAGPGHDCFEFRFAQLLLEPSGNVERRGFLRPAIAAVGAVVLAAMTGIDDDRPECPCRILNAEARAGAAAGEPKARDEAQQKGETAEHGDS